MSIFRWSDPSLIERIAVKVLSRFTFTFSGLRVDGSGVTQPVSGTVTTVAGLGRNTQDGQGIQMSQMTFQCGFRRNLTVS